ncbi:MAG: DegT/DnrJ/EryC1/StrS family aminotransferase [Pseudomonadota bacterium]
MRVLPPARPDWGKTETQLRGIFERRYFANHGPLVNKLDAQFAGHAGRKYAISVVNDGLALMILAQGLDLQGEVIVPALCRPGTFEALRWAGLVPVPCDVEPDTGLVSIGAIRKLITPRTSAILGVHLWGRPCATEELSALNEETGLPIFFDATHGVAVQHEGKSLGTFGQAAYFSFQEGEMINCAEGACIVTDDEKLANKLRTIKNFHPTHTYAQVPLRINGKMSEAQAALALVGLDELHRNNQANMGMARAYAKGLSVIPGLRMLSAMVSPKVIIDIDQTRFGLERNALFSLMEKENLYAHNIPSHLINNIADVENAFGLAQRIVQLPCHPGLTKESIDKVCLLLRAIADNSAAICQRMETKP